MLTVLMVFSVHVHVLTLIILVSVRPSRENAISMPRVPEERLRPPQSTGERPRVFCPCAAPREYPPHTNAKGLTRSRSRWSDRP